MTLTVSMVKSQGQSKLRLISNELWFVCDSQISRAIFISTCHILNHTEKSFQMIPKMHHRQTKRIAHGLWLNYACWYGIEAPVFSWNIIRKGQFQMKVGALHLFARAHIHTHTHDRPVERRTMIIKRIFWMVII